MAILQEVGKFDYHLVFQDYPELKEFLKNRFHKDLREVDLSVKGWNWGEARFRGSLLGFYVDNKPAFEIPLKEVSQVRAHVHVHVLYIGTISILLCLNLTKWDHLHSIMYD